MNAAGWCGMAATVLALSTATAQAETPRELLTRASFVDRDKSAALGRINTAFRAASIEVRDEPGDAEAELMQATALGYRAKLTGSRTEAVQARKQFEALVRRDPRNAEAQLALGAWHIGAVYRLGRLVGRAALGAQQPAGYAALDRAVALGGNRALFSGLAALLRLQMDPSDQRGRALAEDAAKAGTPTVLDRILQRAATQVLVPARAGNTDATKSLAARLLPFGQLPGES
ncbi:hypothetical protein [Sphingomonas gellani]|uniref:hypothetical protein n=1 Tax=Sphingomonas gellani TaxID=1166340 RepID=UPI001FCDE056|nr:hypothetical protein [Sphingomonas gellani]